jgi:hypothetical protein
LNRPSPAIVAKSAVMRLPRLALLLFCGVYVLAGFLGRDPWKSLDAMAFGTMQELALGLGTWLSPQNAAQHGGFDSLLPFWLGAATMKALPFLDASLAARLPFMALLALTLASTWYAVYHLARSPQAQPVAFAFGGEASPQDYARAVADAGLLALIACLGLAQLSHETTPALAQLAFTALLLYGLAAAPWQSQPIKAQLAVAAGLVGLALSGAPTVALLFGLGALLVDRPAQDGAPRRLAWQGQVLLWTFAAVLLAWALGLWHWRVDVSSWGQAASQKSGGSLLRLFIWFMWPAWPLALWTLWVWRRQLASRHVALPLWFAGVVTVSTLITTASDRGLLLALPALAALSAFALPTLRRSVAALIDWFTLIFFTVCGITIWVVWIALQTGVPRQPAANVARLLPGFEPEFSLIAFTVALAATVAWAALVHWRTDRHQRALWKSLVLPAAGATLCWLLLTSLWLPLLNYGRGYAPAAAQVVSRVDRLACVSTLGLSSAQSAALRHHGRLQLQRLQTGLAPCPYLVTSADAPRPPAAQWALLRGVRRPTDKNDDMRIYRRLDSTAPAATSRE